jgi:5-methyltetrahydropteroyltriglutamate--homocysteine methyltransferase
MQTSSKTIPKTAHNEPPCRAEQVGSLLRPSYLLHARKQFASHEIGAAELRAVEDRAIRKVVSKQESLGLQCITDGELRRSYFHLDFLEKIDGITVSGNIAASSDAADKVGFTPPSISVTDKIVHGSPIFAEDFAFLKSCNVQNSKISIPSPTMTHFRGGRAAISKTAYPDLEEFYADMATCFQHEIESLYAAGCRHIQLDDTNLAYLCDPKMCEEAKQRGEDLTRLPHTYAALINESIKHNHDDLHISIHVCRGNFRSTWFSQGGYEAIAEMLFNELDIKNYFLEYDDARAGGFEPLRFVPQHKSVVLGLISSKLDKLEEPKEIIIRIEEASQYLPLDNLCLSPQCGFASTHHGNNLSEEQQWAKLALVKEISDDVWGNAS